VLRWQLARRGLGLVALGYAYNGLLATIDAGWTADVVLRADVLHAIGLSLAGVALLGLSPASRSVTPIDLSSLRARSLVVAVSALAVCPIASRAAGELTGSFRYAVAPLVHVPGVTRMSLVPLVTWAAVGAALGAHWRTITPRWLAGLGGALIAGGAAATLAAEASGTTPAHTNYAIVWNACDLLGRALCVLALGLWLARHATSGKAWLSHLGRGSLLVYCVHLPFCYGRMSRGVARALSMTTATLALALLFAGCFAAVFIRERLRSPSARATPAGLARGP
jgi:hypothetical protein